MVYFSYARSVDCKKNDKKVLFVIPAYNEKENIKKELA